MESKVTLEELQAALDFTMNNVERFTSLAGNQMLTNEIFFYALQSINYHGMNKVDTHDEVSA